MHAAIIIFDYLFLGLFILHALPYLFVYVVMPVEDYKPDGSVNATRWILGLVLNYGSTLTALVVCWVADVKQERTAAFGCCVGYVAWFGSIAVLATLNFAGELKAGARARDLYHDHSWLGTALLGIFNVRAHVGGSAYVDVLVAASIAPAVVAGFLAYWFAEPTFGFVCNTRVDDSAECANVAGRKVCCRIVNLKYDMVSFIPFLIAYVVAGIGAANFLIRLLIERHVNSEQLILSMRRTRVPPPPLPSDEAPSGSCSKEDPSSPSAVTAAAAVQHHIDYFT